MSITISSLPSKSLLSLFLEELWRRLELDLFLSLFADFSLLFFSFLDDEFLDRFDLYLGSMGSTFEIGIFEISFAVSDGYLAPNFRF